jgi:hypothetical protein
VDERLPVPVAECVRPQRRHLCQQAHDLRGTRVNVVDLSRIRIEAAQRTHRGRQHCHRMGVVAEALDEALDVLMHELPRRKRLLEVRELVNSRQFTVEQEVCDLKVGRVLDQILNTVAAVLEQALLQCDVCYRA